MTSKFNFEPWQAVPLASDRLQRWAVIGHGAGSGKPVIADNLRAEEVAKLFASAPDMRRALDSIASFCESTRQAPAIPAALDVILEHIISLARKP